MLTDELFGQLVIPASFPMLNVPLVPLVTPVPSLCELCRPSEVVFFGLLLAFGETGIVLLHVVGYQEAFKVFDGVVATISVFVVDVVIRRNVAIMVFPNLPMKVVNAFSPFLARLEIQPIGSALGVGVSPENDALVDGFLDPDTGFVLSGHLTRSLSSRIRTGSPSRSESMRTNPRSTE
jgi:hypothetical protein